MKPIPDAPSLHAFKVLGWQPLWARRLLRSMRPYRPAIMTRLDARSAVLRAPGGCEVPPRDRAIVVWVSAYGRRHRNSPGASRSSRNSGCIKVLGPDREPSLSGRAPARP
jgi:hypothetical protein